MIWNRAIALGAYLLSALLIAPSVNAQHNATAAEGARGLELYETKGLQVSGRISVKERDSLLANQARQLVSQLETQGIRGLQYDPLGYLAVVAGEDDLAQKQFAARLASPGLSVSDSAYTLLLGVKAFSVKGDNPSRMQIASDYLKQLMVLRNTSVKAHQFDGNIALARSYFIAGNGVQAQRYLEDAFSIVANVDYMDRNLVTLYESFILYANVLSAKPNGRLKIDSVGKYLLSIARAPNALIARDSVFYGFLSKRNMELFQTAIKLTNYLMAPVPPLEAQYWLNTQPPAMLSNAAPDARKKMLNDGRIYVLMFGNFGCTACKQSLPKVDSMRKAMSDTAQFWYVTSEGDVWGATRMSPDTAAQHYSDYYLRRKGYGLPIAMWIGERQSSVDGGTTTQVSPTQEAYEFLGWPTFLITDKKGVVRFIYMGFSENLVSSVIRYLAAESRLPS